MGLRALRKIQIGKETTKGTAVAATAALLGALTMKATPTIHRPVEERGVLAEFSRSVKVANLAELSFDGDATFQQLLYLLHAGVLGSVTPTADGTNGKKWTFTPAMLAAGVFNSFTIEYGDDVQAWKTEYCLAKTIEISGAMNEPLKMSTDVFGRKMTPTSFTTGITPPIVESIISQKGKLFIDAETGGTMGATEKASTLIAFTFTINTGLYPKRYADGSIDFSGYGETFKSAELAATFAFNSAAEAERVKFDGETLRLIRIQIDGSVIDGATPSQHKLTLDLCGIYTAWETLTERDGEDIVAITLSSQRGTTYTKLFEVAVINAVPSLL